MKENKFEDYIENELVSLKKLNLERIEALKEDQLLMDNLEKDLSRGSNLDLNNIVNKLRDYDEFQAHINILNSVNNKNIKMANIFSKQKGLCNLDTLVELITEESLENKKLKFPDKQIFIQLLNKISHENKAELDNWLINIKYPIFEGQRTTEIFEELRNKSPSQVQFFSNYVKILTILLQNDQTKLTELQNEKFIIDNIFSSFIYKKVVYTLLNTIQNSQETKIMEKEVIDFFETLIKYLTKVFHNTIEFIIFLMSYFKNNKENQLININTTTSKEKISLIMNQVVKNVLTKLNTVMLKQNNSSILKSIKFEKIIYLIKIFSGFNKILSKEFSYDIYNMPLISDILTETFTGENISEIIKIQRSFIHYFIKTHIKEKLSMMIEKHNFSLDEIIDIVKMLIKDNYNFIICFKNNEYYFEISSDQIYYYCLNDILGVYRGAYNEEIKIFSNKNFISRQKILFILDLMIKFLVFINKLHHNLESGFINKNIKDFLNTNTSNIIKEINKLIDNYTKILTKELRTNAFDDLINLFLYENLIKLTDIKINEVFNKLNETVKLLFCDLDTVKISMETENYWIHSFLLTIISMLNEQCEKSLKKLPKNKLFLLLTDKTIKIIDQIMNRYTINQDTVNSLKNPIKILKSLFSSLNMNKI